MALLLRQCTQVSLDNYSIFSLLQALSPVGRCKSFEASADGYGRGEGFNAIVMQAPGVSCGGTTHALALIQGSAVNQDGRSSSLTAPNGPAQQVRLSMVTDSCLRLAYIVLDGTDWAACLLCKESRMCVILQHIWVFPVP